ncbi:MAG: hypothetical protein M3Z20_11815 [Chloroflexota bacterium]|nr:hypothetical protein [Chloroflexota bacterium]
MDRSPSHTSPDSRAQDVAFDSLSRSLSTSLPRRGVLGLLAAALVTGGVGALATPMRASRRRKRGKRRSGQHGMAVSERATSIPPNCIYVCCDGTCDSWKMCMKCVKWPKPTTTGGVLTRG